LGREASIHKELLRLVQEFCLILSHVQHLERGEVLIPCIFPLIARLYGCGADHSVDTIGAMMVGALGTALLWSKGGTKGSGTWEAWKGPMSCPAAIYGDPEAEAKLGRVVCQAPGCGDRQLDFESGPKRSQGSQRAKQISVESIRGRVPSEIGGLRRAVAAGGLKHGYDCPYTWFAWTVHPGLVLIWRVFGRFTHIDCKVVRGHLLLRCYR
jgi:hypothetical protein